MSKVGISFNDLGTWDEDVKYTVRTISSIPFGGTILISAPLVVYGSSIYYADDLSIQPTEGDNPSVDDAWKLFSGNNINALTTLGDILAGGVSGAPTRVVGNTTTIRKFLREVGNGTVAALPAFDTVTATDVGLANAQNQKLTATFAVDPTTTNDSTEGYGVGSIWWNDANAPLLKMWRCNDPTPDAANWSRITSSIIDS